MIDLTGRKFGKLTVVEKHSKDKWGGWNWLCKCDCGNETVVSGGHLFMSGPWQMDMTKTPKEGNAPLTELM